MVWKDLGSIQLLQQCDTHSRSQRRLSEPLICPDGSHEIDDGARSLLAMDRKIRGQEKGRPPEFMCVICGMTDAAYVRDDGIYVLPPTVLGP